MNTPGEIKAYAVVMPDGDFALFKDYGRAVDYLAKMHGLFLLTLIPK